MASFDEQPMVVASRGDLVAVFICQVCGASIGQRKDDPVDRRTQHADWHRWLLNALPGPGHPDDA